LNNQKKINILIFFILGIFVVINSGCTLVTPPPDDNNYVVSYIHIKPSSVTMPLGSAKQFELVAYDSEDQLIPVNASEVEWVASYECPVCGKVWKLNPESGSKTTTFTPEREGKYHIWGNYKDKWDDSVVIVE
jgi:hypothetical protein